MKKSRIAWIVANALGLGAGFVAMLQTGMLFEFGLDTDLHWQWGAVPETEPPLWIVLAGYGLGYLVGGLVLGLAQAVVLRSRLPEIRRWVLASVGGFGLMVIVEWPLVAMGIMGNIPGPVEPIIATVGGSTLAGILQYRLLCRNGVQASRWLALWVGGLVLSVVPTAAVFLSLGALNVSLSWPGEIFVHGLVCAGFAAWISGKALFSAYSASSWSTESARAS